MSPRLSWRMAVGLLVGAAVVSLVALNTIVLTTDRTPAGPAHPCPAAVVLVSDGSELAQHLHKLVCITSAVNDGLLLE